MRNDDADIAARCDGDGVIIAVKVVPGASRDKIAGALGGCVKIVTSAPPEKGKANKAVARILAEALGVAVRQVQLVAGQASPYKEFRIAGLTADDVRRILQHP